MKDKVWKERWKYEIKAEITKWRIKGMKWKYEIKEKKYEIKEKV